jgi:DNA-damage-inducible protein J
MAQATLSIRVDEDLKKSVERLAKELGMSLTTLVTVFLKVVEREREIPFKIASDPFYSESNMNYLRKVVADMDAGRNVSEHELIEDE